ncbi:zinc-ribbon domain-containing protein [Roseinatronobacter sp.]|uniref:zinc-ribbon domain-containing protein n=1 Tax=Roseinatronobacter sp. TaxID=1945755 RepID=UPI003F710CAB
MRITCPSCLAQYEIDAALLPADGREVQCSACSHIWFQPAEGNSPPPAKPDPVSGPDTGDADGATDAQQQAPSTPPPPAAPPPEPEAEAPQSEAGRPKSRRLDPSVADVLREEAQFEASQRQREAEGLQSQPDLGLLAGAPWPASGADTQAGEDTSGGTQSPAQTQSAFPDIDDISATLEPAGEARRQGEFQLPQTAQARQRSFLRGFIVPPVLAALLVGLYIASPQIVNALPAAAPVMSAYTGLVDTAREGIQAIVAGF